MAASLSIPARSDGRAASGAYSVRTEVIMSCRLPESPIPGPPLGNANELMVESRLLGVAPGDSG